MTHEEIRTARLKLRLSPKHFARLLEIDESTLRRIEMPPDRPSARKAPVRFERLIAAYLKGFRPDDWPKRGELLPKPKA